MSSFYFGIAIQFVMAFFVVTPVALVAYILIIRKDHLVKVSTLEAQLASEQIENARLSGELTDLRAYMDNHHCVWSAEQSVAAYMTTPPKEPNQVVIIRALDLYTALNQAWLVFKKS